MNEKNFRGASMRVVMKRRVRRAVGNKNARALREIGFCRQRVGLGFFDKSVFGVCPGNGSGGVNAIAGFDFFHAVANGFDGTCRV
jgi:hypothetical protein